ncbi:MAG: hypothetical protein R3C19_01990 [Planctomycetaceae bacterium]
MAAQTTDDWTIHLDDTTAEFVSNVRTSQFGMRYFALYKVVLPATIEIEAQDNDLQRIRYVGIRLADVPDEYDNDARLYVLNRGLGMKSQQEGFVDYRVVDADQVSRVKSFHVVGLK